MNHVGTGSGLLASTLGSNHVMRHIAYFFVNLLFNTSLYSDGEIHLDMPFSRLLGKPPKCFQYPILPLHLMHPSHSHRQTPI